MMHEEAGVSPECPICFLELTSDMRISYFPCCSQSACTTCFDKIAETVSPKCPYCTADFKKEVIGVLMQFQDPYFDECKYMSCVMSCLCFTSIAFLLCSWVKSTL